MLTLLPNKTPSGQKINWGEFTLTRKFILFVMLPLGVLFLLFIWSYQQYTLANRYRAVEAYAGVISNSLWNFEAQAPTDYLNLMVNEQDYERFRIFTNEGTVFVDVQSDAPDPLTGLLITLKLIQRVEITADIHYGNTIIGEISAIWLNKNVYVYFYALILLILFTGVVGLYWRIIQSNFELESHVRARTEELHSANVHLTESEARYRSIFEDSPISLREEDFSGVKLIVDRLRQAGVSDFHAYFLVHPEVLLECVQAVKVLNVNQNTLELFGTDSKETLYLGLAGLFTEKSLAPFEQQLVSFTRGETHFECETLQQTVTGEPLWVGSSVSIPPGYEQTWQKVIVSIIDITSRKKTEEEVARYREHLEDLVAERTAELTALQHQLELRVAQRTKELARVNTGLSAEITERKRLQEEVQRYTEELELQVADQARKLSVLYEVTAVASQVLDLDELLSRSLERSLAAMRCKAGVIHLVDETLPVLRLNTQQGVTDSISDGIATFFAGQGDIKTVFAGHTPLLIPALAENRLMPAQVRQSSWQSYVGVPIQDAQGKLLGLLSILGGTECHFSDEELVLVSSIADHIGLAVENVRLRRQAEETAVLEDRQRLARELHDSVNQSLFSASVIAESLPRLWERNPVLVNQQLDVLHKLISGALAEMRVMLLELRPVSMADAELKDLLSRLVEGVKGRAQLDISLEVHGDCDIPTQVKKNLFRIAQEALNNVVKHARARQVVIFLTQDCGQIKLRIWDDGQGFDVKTVDGAHMGLQIMRERSASIGAAWILNSQPGEGTQIVVTWPAASEA